MGRGSSHQNEENQGTAGITGQAQNVQLAHQSIDLSPTFARLFPVLLGEGPIRLCCLPVLGCLSPHQPDTADRPAAIQWPLLAFASGPLGNNLESTSGVCRTGFLGRGLKSRCRGLAWSWAFCVYHCWCSGATRDFGRWQESTTLHYR